MRRCQLAVAVVLLAGSGCITPTIPLPPPDPDRATFALDTVASMATFQYDADSSYQDATGSIRVYVYNELVNYGVIVPAQPDGSVAPTPPFAAQDGDPVMVIFEKVDERAGMCLLLHHGRSGELYRCP